MDFDEIALLLEVVSKTNPNLYPKLKPIHDAAMERLQDIANDTAAADKVEAQAEPETVQGTFDDGTAKSVSQNGRRV